jgi:hypothetical protein
MLQAFDAPAGDVACVRRPRSNTPLQALVTLNEPLFLECARALGRRTLAEGGSNDPERLGFAFGACTGREPDEREAEILLAWLNRQRARFAEDAAAAQALAVDDPEHPPELAAGQTLAELAVWTATARVLLNLDETITRQ